MHPVIAVQNLSKRYSLGNQGSAYSTLRESITSTLRNPLNRLKQNRDTQARTIWALRDLSLKVYPGERIGIIGHNGAGKSTLLKILSRITEPTQGRVELYGRVGSLLEVGTGFHPELTGRENIALNGAMLGMKRREIARKFEEIVAFAEIDEFLDTPVKRYSSGMYTRLAFAVAAHLEPEILAIDEVLAVGDAAFQKKCLGKMGSVAKDGRTVLFVSHNMTAVRNLCSRAVWLEHGQVVDEGSTESVAANYLKTSFSSLNNRLWDDPQTAPGNDKVRLRRARVRPCDPMLDSDSITVCTALVIEFEYWNLVPEAHLNLSLGLFGDEGMAFFYTGPMADAGWHRKPLPVGLFRSTCHIPANLLNDGTHRIQLNVIQDRSVAIFRADDVLVFEVSDVPELRSGWHGKWPGALRPMLEWETDWLGDGLPGSDLPGESIGVSGTGK